MVHTEILHLADASDLYYHRKDNYYQILCAKEFCQLMRLRTRPKKIMVQISTKRCWGWTKVKLQHPTALRDMRWRPAGLRGLFWCWRCLYFEAALLLKKLDAGRCVWIHAEEVNGGGDDCDGTY